MIRFRNPFKGIFRKFASSKTEDPIDIIPEGDSTLEIIKQSPNEKPDTGKIVGSQYSSIQSALMDDNTKNPDYILRKKGDKTYEDMEKKDSHLYSVYQTRILAISTLPWEILPASESPEDIAIRDFVFEVIDDCRGIFSEDIKQLMDAIGKGFSVLEIVWKLISDGKWKGKYGLDEIVYHRQRFWKFIHASKSPTGEDIALYYNKNNFDFKEVSWKKLIHYAYDGKDSLYGQAAFQPCYWMYWFKKEGWKSWILYLNKYGQPTVLGKYPDGANVTVQNLLMDALNSIQEETAIAIPESMKVSFLESSRSSPASYKDLSDACNAEISKVFLGATQAVEEGRRGSYALSRSHSEVRVERVAADGIEAADVLQQQLVKRIVDFNFITNKYPQFIMRLPNTKITRRTESEQLSEQDRKNLKKAVIKITESIKKGYDSGKENPVINVGPIKKVLSENFSETTAFDFAKKFKTFVEQRLSEENIQEICWDGYEQLCKNIKG